MSLCQFYEGESKVLQYFGNVNPNSAAPMVFTEVVKVTKMLSLPYSHQVLFTGFASKTWSHGFKPTWPFLIVEVFVTRAKFLEPSGYYAMINCTFIFRAAIIFDIFRRIIVKF